MINLVLEPMPALLCIAFAINVFLYFVKIQIS